MDDIKTTYDKNYFTFTSVENEITPGETQFDQESYDEDRQRKELLRCSNDFAYFCNKYVKINHPVKGIIPLVLYNHQRQAFDHVMNNRFAALVKPRQMGISTFFQAWALWRGLFRCRERILMMHRTDREARNYIGAIVFMQSQLPSWMRDEFSKESTFEVKFSYSESTVSCFTPEPACGRSVDWLIFCEVGHIKNMERHWQAFFPMICAGGHCVVYSSVGSEEWFSKLMKYDGCFSEEHQKYGPRCGFSMKYFNYREHPDYDSDEWAQKMEGQLGQKLFRSEVLCQIPDKKHVNSENIKFNNKEIHIFVHHSYEKNPLDFSF